MVITELEVKYDREKKKKKTKDFTRDEVILLSGFNPFNIVKSNTLHPLSLSRDLLDTKKTV